MKIVLNQLTQSNIGIYNKFNSKEKENKIDRNNNVQKNTETAVFYPLISFHGIEEQLLMKYNGILNCAYTGRPMLYNNDVQKIFSKLTKRPNAQSAMHLLQNYKKYMYEIEAEIYELFESAEHKSKKNFADILKEYVPASLSKLKSKQRTILDSTASIVDTLSPETAELVRLIIDNSKRKIEDGSFVRSYPLELLNNIKGKENDSKKLENIYHAWYKLPRTSRDLDAFIVSYAKESHDSIARRLLSPSIATIEHIKPQSRGGIDSMSNYLLVCRQVNSERSSMPLDEYIMLNPDAEIPKHLQEYTDVVITETRRKGSLMSDKSWYPEAIQRAILEETSGYVNLDTSNLVLTNVQKKENTSSQRLKSKYTVKD